ncbi:MAG: HAMP domain-containing sensor histidine kinase [Desulfatitalea sp.]
MPKLFSSVFVKLFAILVAAGIGINLGIILFIGPFRHHISTSYESHLARYIDFLVREIGEPPDLDRARRLAAETAMKIAYDSAAVQWSTHPADEFPAPIRYHLMRFLDGRIRVGSYHGHHVIYVAQNDGRFTFFVPRALSAEKKIKQFGFILLFGITLLLVGVYFAIRGVLKPLQWLKYGVQQVAQGQLAHRVPVKGRDELGELSRSFNTMTQQLAQLIKAKERLVLDVSHELRSPLTRLKVALAMLPDGTGKQSISEDIREMEDKITELLETARAVGARAELKRTPTDLARLITESAAGFRHRPPGVRLGDLPRLPLMAIDPRQIEKVLKNIIDNGLKYSTEKSPPVGISLHTRESYAVVTVTDKGIGIPQADLALVFEPFYRVDPSRSSRTGGYGLGLSLAKTIVDAHGGHIEIDSIYGEGTTVRIVLPM